MFCARCGVSMINTARPGEEPEYMHTPAFRDHPPCSRPVLHLESSAATLGQVAHYVARGSADGRFPSVCRTAFVTEVDPADGFRTGLCVANPTGLFFYSLEMGGVVHHPGDPAETAQGARCNGGDRAYPPGTWHHPERTA